MHYMCLQDFFERFCVQRWDFAGLKNRKWGKMWKPHHHIAILIRAAHRPRGDAVPSRGAFGRKHLRDGDGRPLTVIDGLDARNVGSSLGNGIYR